MSDQDDTDPVPEAPAERSLLGLLAPLRAEEPAVALSTDRVIRTARWQRTVRSALHAAGTVAASVADGTRVILGLGGGAGSGAKRDPR